MSLWRKSSRLQISNTTEATALGSAALVIDGGVSIAKKLTLGSDLLVLSTNNATSTTTGSLQLQGGLGIAKSTVIGNALNVFTSSFSGTPASVFNLGANTFTDTAAVPDAIVPSYFHAVIGQPTLAYASVNVTTSLATTLRIQGAPIAGTNNSMSVLNRYALQVASGQTELSGNAEYTAGYYPLIITNSRGGSPGYAPLLLLENSEGNAGTAAGIDFLTYANSRAYPNASIRAVDVGDFTCDMVFYLKNAGSATNTVTERLRIDNVGRLLLFPSAVSSSVSNNGNLLNIANNTFTNNTSNSGATVTNWYGTYMGITTLAATNANVTTTNSSTLFIAGAPTQGTNVTLTNTFALWSAGGANRFDGAVLVNATTASSSKTSGALIVAGGIGTSGDVYGTNFYSNGVRLATIEETGDTITAGTNLNRVDDTISVVNNPTFSGIVTITNTTVSTNTTSGALLVSGGIGTTGEVYGTNFYSNGVRLATIEEAGASFTAGTNLSLVDDVLSVIDNPTFSGNVTLSSTTLSTSPTTGALVIAGATASRNLNIGTAYNTTLATGQGVFINVNAATYTHATAETVIDLGSVVLAPPTFAATTAGTIVTNAATLLITGAPVQGTNMTLTNANALRVSTGSSYFGGQTTIQNNGETGTIRIAPSTTDSESSIGFYRNNTLATSAAGDLWRLGQNTGAAGAGNFGLSCSGVSQSLRMKFDKANYGTVDLYTNRLNITRSTLDVPGITFDGLDGPMLTVGHDVFTSGTYTGLGRWGLFMLPGYMTLGLPPLTNRELRVSTFNLDSTVANTWFAIRADTGRVQVHTTTASTSTTTGAFLVSGGMGVAGQVTASIISATTLTGTLSTAAQTNVTSVGTLTGLTSSGAVVITDTTVSTNTITGALRVGGGMGIAGDIYGGTRMVLTNTVAGQNLPTLTLNGNGGGSGINVSINLSPWSGRAGGVPVVLAGVDDGTGAAYYRVSVASGSGSATPTEVYRVYQTFMSISATQASTSTSTGALRVSGGAGIAGQLTAATVSATTLTGTLSTASQPNVTSVGTLTGITSSGNVIITATTMSTAANSGALTVAGASGAQTLNAGINFTGAVANDVGTFLNVNGATYTHSATDTVARRAAAYFAAPTFAGTTATNTVTDAATVIIGGAPVQGTNTILTNAHALLVNSGSTFLNGLTSVREDGTNGSLRIFPTTSGNESSIGFYRNSDGTMTTAGDNWVIGQNSGGAGTRNLGIYCSNVSQGLRMKFDSANYGTVDLYTNRLHINRSTNNVASITLSANDGPVLTVGWDPFTSGAYNGIGRWGMFLLPGLLTMGIPNVVTKEFRVSTFNENSTVANTWLSILADTGRVQVHATTVSSSTTTGALLVSGGAGIAGQLTATTVSATTLTGTLTTAAQPNVTSVGTLTGLTSSGVVNITNTTASTSTVTGALIVAGGVGIAGALNVGSFSATNLGGTLTTAAQPNITSVGTLTGLTSSGVINITNTTASNSTITGALTVSGGVGVVGQLTAATVSATNLGGTLTTAAQPNVTSLGTLTGLTSSGVVSITNNTASTSRTTGALQVAGGLGVSGSIHGGSMLTLTDTASSSNLPVLSLNGPGGAAGVTVTVNLSPWSGRSGGAGVMLQGVDDGAAAAYFRLSVASGSESATATEVFRAYQTYMSITATQASTSTTTGALRVAGGAGIAGQLTASTVSATTLTGTLSTAAQTNITSVGTLTGLVSSGLVNITNNTASTSTTTGALVVAGGVGIGGQLTVNTFTASTLGGTLTTAAQPNVTSVGTLTGLTSSGVIVITNTSTATSTTTGALQVAGGGSFAGRIYTTGRVVSTLDASAFNSNFTAIPSVNDAESSIAFFRRPDSSTAAAGDVWVMGHQSWAVGAGNFALGTPILGAVLSVLRTGESTFINRLKTFNANATMAAVTDAGNLFNVGGNTFTNSSTAASGTLANWHGTFLGTPTLAASNASVTTTLATNLYVKGPPNAGTNNTITNRFAVVIDGNGVSEAGSYPLLVTNTGASASVRPAILLENTAGGPGSTTGIEFVTYGNSRNTPTAAIRARDVGDFTSELLFMTKISGAFGNAMAERAIVNRYGGLNLFVDNASGPPSLTGTLFNIAAKTFTNTSAAGNSVTTSWYTANFDKVNLAATNSNVTVPAAVTLYVEGPPSASGSLSILNSFAIWVKSGLSAFDGEVRVNNTTTSTLSTTGAMLVSGNIGARMVNVGRVYTATLATDTGTFFNMISATYTHTASGTIARRSGMYLNAPTFAGDNVNTITDASTLCIAGAPITGLNTTLTNSRALHIVSGTTMMEDNVFIRKDGGNGSLRIAPNVSGNESAIAFFRKNDYATTAEGDVWVMGQNTGGAGSGNFGLYCSGVAQGLRMKFDSANYGTVDIYTNRLNINRSAAFMPGICLNTHDGPMLTVGWDPFTSGNYNGIGRWGLIMEGGALTAGIPNFGTCKFEHAAYNADSTRKVIFSQSISSNVTITENGSGTPKLILNGGGGAGNTIGIEINPWGSRNVGGGIPSCAIYGVDHSQGTIMSFRVATGTDTITDVFRVASASFAGFSSVYPTTDDSVLLGHNGKRWREVWSANGLLQTSDVRFKENIQPFSNGLAFVKAIVPRTYAMKNDRDQLRFGFIANEIENALTTLGIETDKFGGVRKGENGDLAMVYSDFIPPLYKAVQELTEYIEQLQQELERVKRLVTSQ